MAEQDRISADQLIFIVSQPRSGSTLLQALLTNYDNFATVSEPWLLLPFLSHENASIHASVYDSYVCRVALREFKNKIGAESFNNDLKNFLLNQYSKIPGVNHCQFVVDKTPRYYEITGEITHFFPEAKVIILRRNPMATLFSIINTWDISTLGELLKYKRDILSAPHLLYSFLDLELPNVINVEYENLINSPEKELKRIFSWLNISQKNINLDYSANGKFRGLMGDKSILKLSKISKAPQCSWKEKLETQVWAEFANGYARFLGDPLVSRYDMSPVKAVQTEIFDQFLILADL